VGILDAAKRAFRHPKLHTWISREEWSVLEVQNKIDATERAITETETELADAALASTLADDGAAEELATKLDKLRTRKSVLVQALARAEQLEADRVREAQEREAASRRRAAVQRAGAMTRHAAEVAKHAADLQASYENLCSEANSLLLLLTQSQRDIFGDFLQPGHIKTLVMAEQHRVAERGAYQLVSRADARAVRVIEDFASGHIPNLGATLGHEIQAIRAAMSPKPPAAEQGRPAPAGVTVSVEGEGDSGVTLAEPFPLTADPEQFAAEHAHDA
jgi:hypothetical protein